MTVMVRHEGQTAHKDQVYLLYTTQPNPSLGRQVPSLLMAVARPGADRDLCTDSEGWGCCLVFVNGSASPWGVLVFTPMWVVCSNVHPLKTLWAVKGREVWKRWRIYERLLSGDSHNEENSIFCSLESQYVKSQRSWGVTAEWQSQWDVFGREAVYLCLQ